MTTTTRIQTQAVGDKQYGGGEYASRRAYIISWLAMANGDTGDPTRLGDFADRSVQVEGTFDGVSCEIEGSLDGVNYHTLNDGEGNSLVFTTAGLKWVKEAVAYLRPRNHDGGGNTALNVYIFARG